MNYTFNNLVKQYENIDYEYSMNIKGKNATTFSDSYIYQNDIMNIKSKFFDICVSNDELRNAVADLNFDTYTTFNNIIDYKNVLYSKLCEFNSYILEVCENLETASKEAFTEYCQEFTTLENKYDLNKRVFNSKSDLFSTNSETITTKEGEIDKLRRRIDSYQGGGDPSVLSNLKSKIHYLEIDISDLKGQNESHLLFMEWHLSKMKEASEGLKTLLDEALKKMPPFVFV